MRTILVLGSKPDPVLPPRHMFDDVACANASGYSAKLLGLPDPAITVMTAVLSSGNPSDEHSLIRLAGLRTGRLYHLARPKAEREGIVHRVANSWKMRRMTPAHLQRRLNALGYAYATFVARPASVYHQLIVRLCNNDPAVAAQVHAKQPSTGLITLAVAIEEQHWTRYVMAGFDFTLAHAHGQNPLIEQRNSAVSKHATTDIAILRHLAVHRDDLFTTEQAVHQAAGVAMLETIPVN